MPRRKLILKITLAAMLVLAAAAMGLYLAASRVPSEYNPAQLSQDRKEQVVVKQFVRRVMDLGSELQSARPFGVEVAEEQLNEYLASMDEIAAVRPNGRAGQVYQVMDEVGLSGPAVALNRDTVTLMCLLKKHNKVLSADLEILLTPDHLVRVRLKEVRLGRLPIPASMVRARLEQLKQSLRKRIKSTGTESQPTSKGGEGISSDDMAVLLAMVIAAIDEEPLPSEIRKWRMRADDIRIEQGRLQVHFTPTSSRGQTQ